MPGVRPLTFCWMKEGSSDQVTISIQVALKDSKEDPCWSMIRALASAKMASPASAPDVDGSYT